MFYPVRTPWLFKMVYPSCLWQMPAGKGSIYLTFDDGPHEEMTPFVLDELAKRDAKATFFAIGKNAEAHPDLVQRIQDEGHALGSHTWNHVNGWKIPDGAYVADVTRAAKFIPGNLFRPPYGRISQSQCRHLERNLGLRVVMWTLLSGDFDPELDPERCLRQVLDRMRPGDIVVFHDSAKASAKLRYVLPRVMDEIGKRGWSCEKIS
jgi:peptidoglycan/xylan/chitin deacetylase (PgdA/CDA1 family)